MVIKTKRKAKIFLWINFNWKLILVTCFIRILFSRGLWRLKIEKIKLIYIRKQRAGGKGLFIIKLRAKILKTKLSCKVKTNIRCIIIVREKELIN